MRLLSFVLLAGVAQATTPLRYTVSFPEPHTHYARVEAVVPTDGAPEIELMMAVWTPGSYLVREFARQVEDVRLGDGTPLEKSAKNRWRVPTGGKDRVTVRYSVYARELSVRTSFVDADFALINGAPTFLTRPDALDRPHEVTFRPARGWKRSVSGMESRGRHAYRAESFDELVDSPVLLGNPEVRTFQVGGKPHVYAVEGGAGVWDIDAAVASLKKIVAVQHAFWGTVPYERYVVLDLKVETGGGLEHLDSTVVMGSRHALRVEDQRVGWLGLLSHELFHTWNVKRLRPVELGPFDYEREALTRSLWAAEGITSYYDDLLLRRAELLDDKRYLKQLSKLVARVQAKPGRFVRSLGDASWDAWIKQYRPDENYRNVTVDYYARGAVAAWLLDVEIRRRTGGKGTLDEVLRRAYAKYSGEKGYSPAQLRTVASDVAGESLDAWFESQVERPGELRYEEALRWLGLRFEPTADQKDAPGWLGVTLDGAVVREVLRDTPAHAAGLNVGDELLAIGEHRVSEGWDAALRRHRPGEELSLLVARRGLLRRLSAKLGRKPSETWTLQADPTASEAQRLARKSWLTGAGT